MKIRAAVTSAVVLGSLAVAPVASAAGQPEPGPTAPVRTVDIGGVEVDKQASAETKRIIEADTGAATAAANVCGSGYSISTGAVRYGTYGTTYTWTNGTSTGSSYYDKPICAVFFNDTGYTKYMGVRLRSNYTADAPKEDFGAYRSYAGPVYQKRGYCGKVYSYMKSSSGTDLVDNTFTVGSCN
ncbi:hypothetical protein [Streptomyces albus]|uniref:hypothetical protein n=1 Tax=Streptomyces albus TaxID=1888 RepID=UPI0004C810CE|nr:hypothetical protein [Streptomyces albus]